MDVLKQFTEWATKLSQLAYDQSFTTEITAEPDYFTKVNLDNELFVAEITFWKNQNLFVAEILNVNTGEQLYMHSGEYDSCTGFLDCFSGFLKILNLKEGVLDYTHDNTKNLKQ